MRLALPVGPSRDSLGVDPPLNVSALSPTPAQRQLALELGWEADSPELATWLQSLLDDEFELLEPVERGRLRARLAGQPQAETCPECGNDAPSHS